MGGSATSQVCELDTFCTASPVSTIETTIFNDHHQLPVVPHKAVAEVSE